VFNRGEKIKVRLIKSSCLRIEILCVTERTFYHSFNNVKIAFGMYESTLVDVLFLDTQQELDTVQQVKEEIEELREYVNRLEEHSHRRKLRLLEQVTSGVRQCCFSSFFIFYYFL